MAKILTSVGGRLLALLLVLLVPGLLLIVYSTIAHRNSARRQAESRALDLARSISRTHEESLRGAVQVLSVLASLPALRDRDAAACAGVFQEVMQRNPEFSGLAAADADGLVFASVPATAQVGFADRPWFRQVLRTGELALSEYQLGRISGKPTAVVARPVLAGGRPVAVLSAGVGLEWLAAEFNRFRLPPGSVLLILDASGTVLLRHPGPEPFLGRSDPGNPMTRRVLSAEEGVVEAAGLDGGRRLFGFTSFQFAGGRLSVSIGMPAAAAYAEARRTFLLGMLFLAVLAVLAALIATVGHRSLILAPMRRVLGTLQRLAAGELGARSSGPEQPGEFGQIGQAVDRTAAALELREAQREHAEERYRRLFTELSEGFALLEMLGDQPGRPVDFRILEVNPAFERITGLKREQVVGRTARELAAIPDPALLEFLGGVADSGQSAELEHYSAGLGKHLQLSAFSPRRGLLAALFMDITARKTAEQRLQHQLRWTRALNSLSRAVAQRNSLESVLRVVLGHLEMSFPTDCGGVALLQPDTDTARIAALGSAGCEMAGRLGLTEQGLIAADEFAVIQAMPRNQATLLDLKTFPAETLTAESQAFLAQALAEGLQSVAVLPFAVEDRPLGFLFFLSRRGMALDEYAMSFLSGIAETVGLAVQSRELYAQLEQSYARLQESQRLMLEQERLRAMGQMAAGIAHDINNTLAPIALYTEALLDREAALSERARRFLATIQQAARDIESTTLRLRAFYHRSDEGEEFQIIDVPGLLAHVTELSRPRWETMPNRTGIVIRTQIEADPELPALIGVESEIREALVNLIFNAVDALPQGGLISLRAQVTGDCLALEVVDNGVGMDEEQRRRCLEPFYTTKGDKGTGLGLSTVYGVMQRHGGSVRIDSALGRGTRVCLGFPRREAIPVKSQGEQMGPAAALRLLCIDDDPAVRRVLREILEMEGHAVEDAGGGEEAIARFGQRLHEGLPPDLVITDLGMPYMDGWEVARQIKELSPGTPVILLSGWSGFGRFEAPNPADSPVDRLLGKPPKLEDLRQALSELTGKRAREPSR